MGRVVNQSRALGNNALNDVHARPGEKRGSRSLCAMPVHTDAAGNDVHQEFNVQSDPGALDILARGFFDRHPGGDDVMPFTQGRVPALRFSAGRVGTVFAEKYVDKERLTEEERAAMNTSIRQMNVNWFRGDAAFWHNHRSLHWATHLHRPSAAPSPPLGLR